jgi:CHAT domain-containing protein
MWGAIGMGYYKIGRSVFVSLLMVLSASFVPSLSMVLMTSRVLAQTVDARKAEADRLLNQGGQQYHEGQFKAALLSWNQALQIYRQINDRAGISSTVGNLGLIYIFLADYKKAIEFFDESLAIAKEFGDLTLEGAALVNLGIAYDKLGKHKQAIKFYQQGLIIFKEIGSQTGEGRALTNLGIAYSSLGDYAKAIEFFQQSLAIAKEIGDRGGVGAALGNLGSAYNSVGDYQKAIDLFQQRLVIAKEIGHRADESSVLSDLGNAYYFLRDYQKAINLFQQSLVIVKEIGDRAGVGDALGNLGNIYNSLGEYKKAIDFYQQSLVIAKEIGNPYAEGGVLTNMGLVYNSLEDYKKAIELHKQSLVLFKEIGNRDAEGSALNNLGLALFKSKNFVEAEKVLKYGVEVRKSQRSRLGNQNNLKISIFERQANIYSTLQQVLIAQNKTDAALEVAESGRARAFVDLLTSRLSPNGDIYSATEPTIDQIKQIAKAQNSTLVQYSIIGKEFKVADKPQTIESELYIWVIKPTGEVTFRKADLKPLWQKENTTLYDLVTTSRQSIGARGTNFRGIDVSFNPDAPKATNKLKRLHELLIEPIADLLPKNPNARVTFIPQRSLFLVPFPALQDANGKYLIEKHTILTSPSIQVLQLTHEKRQQIGKQLIQGNNMLIVGNPIMPKIPPKIGEPPQQLTPLPGAEREAKAIAQLFKTQALIGNQATETTVTQRLPQARLIHLATHGIFDDFQGLNSGIALTPSSENEGGDGLLTAGEILDLKLSAELVVLSACDTGRGEITGDGVIGLSRSWISAGVPSVLVSLWSVPDAPTAELMTEFYQNLQNNPDKATALRQAMLTTMKQHPNPVDWAAFTLIGEAE